LNQEKNILFWVYVDSNDDGQSKSRGTVPIHIGIAMVRPEPHVYGVCPQFYRNQPKAVILQYTASKSELRGCSSSVPPENRQMPSANQPGCGTILEFKKGGNNAVLQSGAGLLGLLVDPVVETGAVSKQRQFLCVGLPKLSPGLTWRSQQRRTACAHRK
jgi:hypothetical protein